MGWSIGYREMVLSRWDSGMLLILRGCLIAGRRRGMDGFSIPIQKKYKIQLTIEVTDDTLVTVDTDVTDVTHGFEYQKSGSGIG